MDIFDRLHNMSVKDRVEYARKLAEKYGYDFDARVDVRYQNEDEEFVYFSEDSERDKEKINSLAELLCNDEEPLILEDAQDILFFCLFEEVGNESGHILADRVLLRVIEKELGGAAQKLITMWLNISKWYS